MIAVRQLSSERQRLSRGRLTFLDESRHIGGGTIRNNIWDERQAPRRHDRGCEDFRRSALKDPGRVADCARIVISIVDSEHAAPIFKRCQIV